MSTPNPLEQALSNAGEDVTSKKDILKALVQSRVTVLLDQPWDGRTLPSAGMNLLLVSDGPNAQQPMLAVFSTQALAREFMSAAGPFQHPADVDAAWALLGVPKDAGIMLNPNSVPNFRISPEVAGMLRESAEKNLERRINPGGGPRTE